MTAFRRFYIDIPTPIADKFKVYATEQGKSQRALMAELVEQAVTKGKPATRKTSRKKKGKK